MDRFFKRNRVYAVFGASTNPQKFGFKVFKWYKDRNLPAIPINIHSEAVLGTPALGSFNDLHIPSGSDVAISVITPPAVTDDLIESLKVPVEAIWLQPGTYTQHTIELAKRKVKTVITDCILVNGDKYLSKL